MARQAALLLLALLGCADAHMTPLTQQQCPFSFQAIVDACVSAREEVKAAWQYDATAPCLAAPLHGHVEKGASGSALRSVYMRGTGMEHYMADLQANVPILSGTQV